ncbi:MAG TPA: hypothetical protein VN514_09310 [Ignavibacteria bacterium]|nr:hypothetical protein [Ignavibacteria bacterium]
MIDEFNLEKLKKQFRQKSFNDKFADKFYALDFGSSRKVCVTCNNLEKDDTGYFSFADYSKPPDSFSPPPKRKKTKGRKKYSKR